MVFYFRDGGPEKFSQSHRNGESGGRILFVMIANVLKDNFFGDLSQVYVVVNFLSQVIFIFPLFQLH